MSDVIYPRLPPPTSPQWCATTLPISYGFSCPSYRCLPNFNNNSNPNASKACRRPGSSLAGAPPLRTGLASDGRGGAPRSTAADNVACGSCSWVCTGFVMRRASWSLRWLDVSHRLFQSLPMQRSISLLPIARTLFAVLGTMGKY